MKMKTMMIATAAKQRPMNRSSRAVKSRSATVPSYRPLCRNDTTGRRGKNHTAQNKSRGFGGFMLIYAALGGRADASMGLLTSASSGRR
jgi:hypothetical protein